MTCSQTNNSRRFYDKWIPCLILFLSFFRFDIFPDFELDLFFVCLLWWLSDRMSLLSKLVWRKSLFYFRLKRLLILPSFVMAIKLDTFTDDKIGYVYQYDQSYWNIFSFLCHWIIIYWLKTFLKKYLYNQYDQKFWTF